jgi:hypothetical protein
VMVMMTMMVIMVLMMVRLEPRQDVAVTGACAIWGGNAVSVAGDDDDDD